MPVAASYPIAKAVRLNKTLYSRLSDVKPTDNGLVTFKLGVNPTFTGYADNSYGGGWILWLQYVHQGGTNPVLRTINANNNLPVLSSTALGGNDSANNVLWGAGSAAFLQAFPDATADLEFRFYGVTSAHARVIHFKTDSAMVSRFRDNVGSMLDVNFQYALLTGHTAVLPRVANSTFNAQSLTDFPFYTTAAFHWGIRGIGSRWEVDDFPNNSAHSTIHRVWVRYKPGNTFPLVRNGDFTQGVTNWILVGNVVIAGGVMTFNGSNLPATGIASQVCQTEAGGMYNLRYSTIRSGAVVGVVQVMAEVRDSVTNDLIASQLSTQAAGTTVRNIQFTARGPVVVIFIDQSVATAGVDISVDDVSISRYVQNG